MIRTFIGYSKEGKKIQCYMLNHYNFNKLKKYMTLEEYESIEYIQEYKSCNEDYAIINIIELGKAVR